MTSTAEHVYLNDEDVTNYESGNQHYVLQSKHVKSVMDDLAGLACSDDSPKHKSVEKKTWQHIAKQFENNVHNGENLDIYQFCAFLVINAEKLSLRKGEKWLYFIKAICCCVFQTLFWALVIIDYTLEKMSIAEEDIVDKTWINQSVSVVACIYISLNIISWIESVDEQGLYEIDSETMENCPPYIHTFWIYIGLYTNLITLFIALCGSYLLIYFSESSMEVILNCVAAFFMVEVDNLMMTTGDYEKIQKWLKKKQNKQKKYVGNCEQVFAKCMYCFGKGLVYVSCCIAICAPIAMTILFTSNLL